MKAFDEKLRSCSKHPPYDIDRLCSNRTDVLVPMKSCLHCAFDSQVGNAIVEMTVLKSSKIAEPIPYKRQL
jgi:hypothetical protein